MIINVIGDVTGFAESLKLLHKQMPEGELWGVGDLIDRGPFSKEVMDYFMQGGHKSVMGNHDHMMLFEKIKKEAGVNSRLYPDGCWGYNGGDQTLESFGVESYRDFDPSKFEEYFKYIEQMPLRQEFGNLMITHAPISDRKNKKVFDLKEINKNEYLLDVSALWNRSGPTKVPGKFQVYGHNSTRGILWHTDKYPQGIYMADPNEIPDNAWAVCIDTWRETFLTGLSIDTDLLDDPKKAVKVFQQDLVETSPFISKVKQNVRAAQKEYLATTPLKGVSFEDDGEEP
jgi:serine/threonine protein phosphatase 1